MKEKDEEGEREQKMKTKIEDWAKERIEEELREEVKYLSPRQRVLYLEMRTSEYLAELDIEEYGGLGE